jgi:hypothetical protein
MAVIDYEDYLDAGLYIFPLHPIVNGRCGCGDEECKVPGKHPVMANWQHITTWDDEQLAFLTDEEGLTGRNQFLDGFGVNLAGKLLVIDVDARNGGVESFGQLCADTGLDLLGMCGFAVETGSGGGSMHLYFKAPEPPVSMVTNLNQYKGIDFKSSGYVVGCGSEHISGDRYSVLHGSPDGITDPPGAVVELLKKRENLRTFEAGRAVDFTMQELRGIVMAISNDGPDYEKWIRVGMGIHEATSGSQDGYDLWLDWSAECPAHDDTDMPKKWRSFHDSQASNVTLGTLLLWAKECGYQEPVTFESVEIWQDDEADNITNKSVRDGVNLKRPPGMVGDIAAWTNSRCMFPREYLSVGAALVAVSNAAGLRYRVAGTNTTLNQLVFGIASSATGKETVYQRLIECHQASGISSAIHGAIKSEQEIIRNALRNQASFYAIDEIGGMLAKLNNAKKKGSTAYLEGVMTTIMSIFSKANAVLPVGGDMKEEIRDRLQRDIARAQKSIDESPNPEKAEARLADLLTELKQVDNGIVNPFLSLYGTAEPYTFANAIDREMIVGGFMGRALVIEEPDNAPRRKPLSDLSHADMPDRLAMQLAVLYSAGSAAFDDSRIERHGDVVYLQLDDEAQKAADDVYDYWHGMAQQEQDGGTGLEPLALRAWETTLKVAGTLGCMGGVITLEHMRYAHALVYKSTMWKINKAKAAEGAGRVDTETKSEGVVSAVLSILDKSKAMTIGVMKNRYRGQYSADQIQQALDWLVENGEAVKTEEKAKNGRTYVYYRLA